MIVTSLFFFAIGFFREKFRLYIVLIFSFSSFVKLGRFSKSPSLKPRIGAKIGLCWQKLSRQNDMQREKIRTAGLHMRPKWHSWEAVKVSLRPKTGIDVAKVVRAVLQPRAARLARRVVAVDTGGPGRRCRRRQRQEEAGKMSIHRETVKLWHAWFRTYERGRWRKGLATPWKK